jgi:16S rRNA (guanine966-N2)-methyltransferase
MAILRHRRETQFMDAFVCHAIIVFAGFVAETRRSRKFPSPTMPATKRKSAKQLSNRVRIVGGTWRSRMIEFPDALGLRPTPDRVRETLFNWLGQTLHGKRCLDLFAGSGALGFEAASRGAESVVMVEAQRVAQSALEKNKAALDARAVIVVGEDAIRFLDRHAATKALPFDVIFLDPPFASDLLAKVMAKLVPAMAEGALVYAECGEALAPRLAAHGFADWHVVKEGRAGQAHFALLSRPDLPQTP